MLGIPFDFTAKPVISEPKPPKDTVRVNAVLPERAHLEIRFPQVTGYRVELPDDRFIVYFDDNARWELTPLDVGPAQTKNAGIIGEAADLGLDHLENIRTATLLFHLTQHLIETQWRDPDQEPKLHLFGQLKRITKQWLETCLICKGGTKPGVLLYKTLADQACNRITAAITEAQQDQRPIKAILDPYNPTGATRHVRFTTTKTERYETDSRRCQINWVICDSEWEAEFCRVAEAHPRVLAYVKNHNLGFEVPYRFGSETRRYRPDFIVQLDDGQGREDPLHLVVEIKGYRGEDAKDKAAAMNAYWIPGVNHLKVYGRWAFAEFTDVFQMQTDFQATVENEFARVLKATASHQERPFH